MKRLGLALTLTAACVFGAAAFAEEPPSPEGGPGFPAADINEREAGGIQNWWSWDYGPSAKDPAHKHLPPPFGYALINFVIFGAIMMRLLGRPLKQMALDRHTRIRTDLDDAAKLRNGAQAMLLEYQKKVSNADAEIEELLTQIRNEAELEKTRIIAAAEAQAKRLKEEAEKQIAAEIERARMELRRDVIERAVAAAEQILKQNIGADDQRKMAEGYVADLEKRTS